MNAVQTSLLRVYWSSAGSIDVGGLCSKHGQCDDGQLWNIDNEVVIGHNDHSHLNGRNSNDASRVVSLFDNNSVTEAQPLSVYVRN